MTDSRRAPRLVGWDYSTPGAYLVTLVADGRRHLFGAIEDGEIRHSELGKAVESEWQTLPGWFGGVRLDSSIVMPNHLHGIVWLERTDSGASSNLIKVIQAFKSKTTRSSHLAGLHAGPLWQRSFHDRIIRDDAELGALREYVVNNPKMWPDDPER